jgi:acylphosphatase
MGSDLTLPIIKAMASEEVRVRAVVRGRVQRVGFRAFVLRHATAAKLRGMVRNNDDGSVEAVLEGPRGEVEKVVERLHQGPAIADVRAVDVEYLQPSGDLPAISVTA